MKFNFEKQAKASEAEVLIDDVLKQMNTFQTMLKDYKETSALSSLNYQDTIDALRTLKEKLNFTNELISMSLFGIK